MSLRNNFYDGLKLLLSVVLVSTIFLTSYTNEKPRQSVGLVLSGGGAKGIAHIGVIKALEENNIPIDFITGTSMGAIVGGLYAAGYTPNEIVELILSDEFSHWSTGTIDRNLIYNYLKPDKDPTIVSFNLSKKDSIKSSNFLPASFINPLPMNMGYLELFTPHTAACKEDFNQLFVPFRCVASDIYRKEKVVLSKGNLGDAIRMSMTFPVAFKPIEYNGYPMFDGGIYDNFPVDVMKSEFAPDIIIGVDVSVHEEPDLENLVSQLESMVIQQEDYTLSEDDGIKIHIDLKEYGLLDFPKAEEITKKGYDKANLLMDSIKTRIYSRVPHETVDLKRQLYKASIPNVLFDTLTIEGTNKLTSNSLRQLFHPEDNQYLDIPAVKKAYYRAITTGKFKDLVLSPEYIEDKNMFNLKMKVDAKDDFGVGVGGYWSSSTNSMIFLSANYKTLNLSSFETQLKGWVGQSYYGGMLDAKISMLTKFPAIFKLNVVASRQKFYENDVLFFEDDLPALITKKDFHAQLMCGLGLGRNSKLDLSLGFGYLNDLFYSNNKIDFSSIDKDEGRYKLGQIKLKYHYTTLDNDVFPSEGGLFYIAGSGFLGRKKFILREPGIETEYSKLHWLQAELYMQQYIKFGKHFSLGAKLDAIISNKKLFDSYTASIVQAPAFLPTQATQSLFIPELRANSFVSLGILPIVKIIDNLQFRTEFYGYTPMREILADASGKAYYGKWFNKLRFLGEASLTYNLPFASISLYGNYINSNVDRWNFGISFGYFITAPKFLR